MLTVALIDAGRPVLSWDEIATADAARRTPAQIWHLIEHIDGVFGAYYFLIHFWTRIAGTSELALRLPSVLAMAGAAALTGELGRRLFEPATGAVAGVLLCLMPNTSRYAAEARPYAFACFFALLALLLLHCALDRPGWARWTGYGLAVLALGLAHVIALTTLGAHIAVLAQRRRLPAGWAVAAGAALVTLGPVFWLGLHERHAQLSWIAPLTPGSLWKFPGAVVGSTPGGWLLLGLALIALLRPARPLVEVIALALTPIVAVAAVSVLVAPYWVARYLLVVLAPLALTAADGLIRQLSRPGVKGTAAPVLATVALLATAVLPGQLTVRGATAKNGSDYRTAARIIEHNRQPGDAIVYTAHSRTLRAGLDSYLRHYPSRPDDLLLARDAATVGSLRADEYPDAAARAARTTRIWLLLYGRHPDPTTARPELRPVLRTGFRRAGIWHLHRATLALFIRHATSPPTTVRKRTPAARNPATAAGK
jgi:mannosyltransferase